MFLNITWFAFSMNMALSLWVWVCRHLYLQMFLENIYMFCIYLIFCMWRQT